MLLRRGIHWLFAFHVLSFLFPLFQPQNGSIVYKTQNNRMILLVHTVITNFNCFGRIVFFIPLSKKTLGKLRAQQIVLRRDQLALLRIAQRHRDRFKLFYRFCIFNSSFPFVLNSVSFFPRISLPYLSCAHLGLHSVDLYMPGGLKYRRAALRWWQAGLHPNIHLDALLLAFE